MEINPSLFQYFSANRNHHRGNIRSAAIGISLDEVCVLGGNLRSSYPEPLHAHLFDEATSAVPGRIPENRSGIRSARLMLATPSNDLRKLLLTVAAIPGGEFQSTLDNNLFRPDRRVSVPESEIIRSHQRIFTGAKVNDVDPPDRGRHVRTVAASVHSHRSPDRARHADGPFEAGQSCRHTSTSDNRKCGPTTDTQCMTINFDGGQPVAELDDDAVEAEVGHEQIGTAADHQHVDRIGPGSCDSRTDTAQISERFGNHQRRG
jgi:hypothetical protein